MSAFKDPRISYCFADGRKFWQLIRNISKNLDKLNQIYEISEPHAQITFYLFPDAEPDGYHSIRIKTLDAISELTGFYGLSSTTSITARYLNPSSLYSGIGYSKGGLYLVRLNESNLSRHISKMRMLYDTSCQYYSPHLLYDYVCTNSVIGLPMSQQLSIDIEELKRLLVLFSAALAVNGTDSSSSSIYPQRISTN